MCFGGVFLCPFLKICNELISILIKTIYRLKIPIYGYVIYHKLIVSLHQEFLNQ